MIVLELALGLAISLSLGLLGGSSTILAVPARVYRLGQKGFKTVYDVSGGTSAWMFVALDLEH